MEKVKKMVRAGVSIPTAIKEAHGVPISEFAERHGLVRASVANHINGTVRPTDETIAALIEDLGGSADEWRELLWLASKPITATAGLE